MVFATSTLQNSFAFSTNLGPIELGTLSCVFWSGTVGGIPSGNLT